MMNLSLLMAAPATTPPAHAGTQDRGTSPHGEDTGFEATLTALLGDAGKEVVEMVETLGKLADLDREHDALAAIGWPMPALLALAASGGDEQATLVDELAAALEVDGDAEAAAVDVEAAGAALVGHLAETADDAGETDGETTLRVGPRAAADATTTPTVAAAQAAETEGSSEVDDVDETAAERGTSSSPRASDGALPDASTGAAGPATAAAPGGDTDHLDVEDEAVVRSSAGVRADRADGKGDERTAGTTREPASSDRAGTMRVDASADRAPTAGETLSARPEPARPTPNAGMSAAIQRVMEAIDRLETLPPPQRLTVDLGEVRIRVSMEDGQVRLAVIDGDGEVGDELLQDARDELAQRGFDLGADRDQADGAGIPADDTHDDQPQRPRTRERVASGLRL